MPLPPLADPSDPSIRRKGFASASGVGAFLFSTLIAFNGIQVASIALRPLSRSGSRTLNRWAADTWWGLCVSGGEVLYDVRLNETGDEVPMRENAIVVVNHQQMTDVTFLMAYARTKDRLGDLKWFVKDPVKYVPGVGWGMWMLDCPFLKRNWADDKVRIDKTFSRLVDDKVPMWLVTFPEGTRLTPEKLESSRRFATEQGLTPPRHVMVPRTKGFVASVRGLRNHVRAVYDVTIGYERGVPSLWQYMKGFSRRAHLHVRRYLVESLPDDDQGLANWLLDRFKEKDDLLERFYDQGAFVG